MKVKNALLLFFIFIFSSCKEQSLNPYLDLKNKPSTVIAKDNKRAQRKGARRLKRQTRKNRRYYYNGY